MRFQAACAGLFRFALPLFAWAESAAFAGAWQPSELTWLTIQTTEFYRTSTARRSFEQLSIRSYTEWAALPGLTLGGKVARSQQVSESADQTTLAQGVSDAQLFAIRHWAGAGSWVLAGRVTGVFATSKFARDVRVVGQDAAIGYAALAGWSAGRLFAELDAEHRLSLGADADQFRLQITGGVHSGPLLVLLQGAATESFTSTAGVGLDYDLGQASLSAVLPVGERLSLELGGRQDIYGRGLDKGSSVFFSLWWRT